MCSEIGIIYIYILVVVRLWNISLMKSVVTFQLTYIDKINWDFLNFLRAYYV